MENLNNLNTKELQELLRARGLPVYYKLKVDLVERLKNALKSEKEEKCGKENTAKKQYPEKTTSVAKVMTKSPKTSEDESENFVDAENKNDKFENLNGQSIPISNMSNINGFTFRDVEDSLENFDGEKKTDIKIWLKNFNDVASVCGWNDIQKYLYTRRLLKGAAKLAVEAAENISNWEALQSFLMQEFSFELTSVSIHRTLETRKKKNDETFLEYMYTMKVLSQNRVDEQSLLSYIVDGIPDDVLNKTVLYEATSFEELKKKFIIYQNMKSKMTKHMKTEISVKIQKNKNIRCSGCGAKSHVFENCPHKLKGSRCFRCNAFGHIAPNCPQKKNNENRVNIVEVPDMHIKVVIEKYEFLALVDTGSDVTLIKSSVKEKINKKLNIDQQICLTGFGKHLQKTLGCCEGNVEIGEEIYSIKFHVVPNEWISSDVLIGKNILKQATLLLKNGKVMIHKAENIIKTDEISVGEDHFKNLDVVQLISTDLECLENINDKYLKNTVKNIIDNYNPIVPEKSCIEMSICLHDETPVYQKPRRLAPLEQEIASNQIKQWLDDGIIRHSNSDFASPIVIVKKKDGSSRLCVDYRKLNRKIVKDRYPLPVIEEILENLYNARVFSTLDLKNGFFHVDIKEECKKYTSFVTKDGQYEFLKAPFGLCNSPAVFQRFINTIFQPLQRKGVLFLYLDDIIIPSFSEEENIEKLNKVLEVAEKHGLQIKWQKCSFLQRKIQFLGHILENGTVRPSSEKIKAVQNFPPPKNLKDLQKFLGLTGFFRKFVQNYSAIAKPLTDLIKKNVSFEFGSREQDAFKILKDILCSDPVLKLFNPENETELHTDASKVGLGAVLLQRCRDDKKLHPVFYLSYKTTETESKYSSYELEVLSIIKALKKLRPYLLGLKFKIYTDCRAFQLTMKKKELCSRVARWALLLEEYNCEIYHRSGSMMQHADALSRYPSVFSIEDNLLLQVKRAQQEDENCRSIATILKDRDYEDYVLRNGIIYKFHEGNYILVIPRNMQKNIVKMIHEQGHINSRKVANIIQQSYYIPHLEKKIEQVLINCIPCILAAKKSGKQEGVLNPIEKVASPLHTYHLDHLGPLPSTAKNYKYLFVVVDAFTKFCWLYPVKAPTTGEVIKKLSLQSEVFGNPFRVITDRGTAFTSVSFKSYCEEQLINHVLVTTGVPRGNGQVERLNQIIISVLSRISVDDPHKWFKHVSKLQQTINSTVSRATGKTPFELLIGIKMSKPEDCNLIKAIEEAEIVEFEDNRDRLRLAAKEQILKIQAENRSYSNRKRKPARIYKVRDLVAVKRSQFTPGSKLLPKYLGPYEVTKIKGKDRYDLQKVGLHEGPNSTSSAADLMKPWATLESGDESTSSEADEAQDGRM